MHGLSLRGHPDPMGVGFSEIMLQQTRVETGHSYFRRWMERFSNHPGFAGSSEPKCFGVLGRVFGYIPVPAIAQRLQNSGRTI